MLQIKHIKKQYKTGSLVQQALNDVSVNFRDNEFVAILGPSGSGKTTLLNVIGGLDRYDSGELIINSVTTKKYKDADWDYYRNHTIGFVFQSYNLIPHQTVLANVELALTISGVSGSEKRQRAIEALRSVGLEEQMHKKPAQMSGGQMQRVAIARALVNNPDIVLADEPTGALDSETSVQVMELLKQVAKDRLVVMVTHNPELAKQYATRIVTIKDGKILQDTNPFHVEDNQPVRQEKTGRSSMSFLTALSLSFNNLKTKLARTLLVAIAGSIGIIGIALIMSLSNGVNKYIDDTEKEAMSEYPLQITSVGYDLTSMMSNVSSQVQQDKEQSEKDEKTDQITVVDTISSMFKGMNTNDLKSLKEYFESGNSSIKEEARSIEYIYDITPQIYQEESDGIHKISPSDSYNYTSMSSMMSSGSSSSSFFALPKDSGLYTSQYTLEAGHWPENSHECVLVLSSGGSVTDTLLYSLGMKDRNEMTNMMNALRQNKSYTIQEDNTTYTYADFLNREFKVLSSSDFYSYDSEHNLYTDHEDNEEYIQNKLETAIPLTITGIVKPGKDQNSAMLSTGIGYTSSLTEELMERSAESDVVRAQLQDSTINVFTGNAFSDETDRSNFDLSSLFQFDSSAFEKAFQVNTSSLSNIQMDIPSVIDPSALSNAMPDFRSEDLLQLLQSTTITQENLTDLMNTLLLDFRKDENSQKVLNAYVTDWKDFLQSEDARIILQEFLRDHIHTPDSLSKEKLTAFAKEFLQDYTDFEKEYIQDHPDANFDTLFHAFMEASGNTLLENFSNQILQEIKEISLSSEDVKELANTLYTRYEEKCADGTYTTDTGEVMQQLQVFLQSEMSSVITPYLETNVAGPLSSSFTTLMQTKMGGFTEALSSQLSNGMSYILGSFTQQISSIMENAFQIDPNAFADAFQINMTTDDLQDLFSSLSNTDSASYTGNLQKLGYAEKDTPSEIDIYPEDFNSKERITDILNTYNQSMKAKGEDDKVIVFTDFVATMLSSVTTIVNTLSYVLIAFVAISLIVSSIMIGVITYISVLERRKEIGILRALGASKHNITQVFNAETVITGFLAGILGVGIACLLLIPGNVIIHMIADNDQIHASLPVLSGIGLVILSVILTLLAGLLPARKAAKSDPVIALRSE